MGITISVATAVARGRIKQVPSEKRLLTRLGVPGPPRTVRQRYGDRAGKQKTVCVRSLTPHVERRADRRYPKLRSSGGHAHFVLRTTDLRSFTAVKNGVQSAISTSTQLNESNTLHWDFRILEQYSTRGHEDWIAVKRSSPHAAFTTDRQSLRTSQHRSPTIAIELGRKSVWSRKY